MEALVKETILFTDQEWKDLVMCDFNGTNVDGKTIQCLARVPNILQRCKTRGPSTTLVSTGLKHEIESLRQDVKAVIVELRDRLNTVNMDLAPKPLKAHIHAHCLCIYVMGLATGVILNCLLNMLEGECFHRCEESSHYANEMFQSAKSAEKYLPLGSLAMVLFLGFAWLGAPDSAIEVGSATKKRIESLLNDYEKACQLPRASNMCTDLETMKTRFTLRPGLSAMISP